MKTTDFSPFPEASLNRLVLPSSVGFKQYAGQNGYQLLSSQSVNTLKEEKGRAWTDEYSRRLLTLLETLWSGSAWTDHLPETALGQLREFWGSTTEVRLGGGILNGDEGKYIFETVLSYLQSSDYDNKTLSLAFAPQNMALDGLLKEQQARTLAIDFGHTSVKSSYITSEKKRMKLDPVMMDLDGQYEDGDYSYAESVQDKVIQALINILNQLQGAPVTQLRVSIAAYISEGQFMINERGAYCLLRKIEKNVDHLFSTLWMKVRGTAVPTKVFHDGNAAAQLLSTRPGAVIVLGTSIGYGFCS